MLESILTDFSELKACPDFVFDAAIILDIYFYIYGNIYGLNF